MIETTIPRSRHRDCKLDVCSICLEDHRILEKFFDSAIQKNGYCWLEQYRKWLDSNKIPSEKNGWASCQAWEEKNIAAFIAYFLDPNPAEAIQEYQNRTVQEYQNRTVQDYRELLEAAINCVSAFKNQHDLDGMMLNEAIEAMEPLVIRGIKSEADFRPTNQAASPPQKEGGE